MIKLPIIDREATARNITRLRIENNFTTPELMDILGLTSTQSIYHWENGRSIPRIDILVMLSALYKVKIDDIIIIKKEED